ncbi:F-box protein SKIP23 [Rhynchospora pubera]|uniref:F-box protein SKIP23 n=1 Tax=Rhynchospora pubera TaxID=906938 RepID=A0AAV8CV63_9POAL|nr:F-box protein SKIP23 [Rhynchospora pubera]
MTRNKKTVPKPWGDLHPDLLHHIYTKLYDPVDFIRFRAVCKGWHVGTPLSERPPQFPLLLEREPDPLYSPEFKLYSLPTGRTYKLQLPEVQNKMFFEQSQGHLVTFGTGDDSSPRNPTIFNPFTRAELPLPFGNCNFFSPIYIGTSDPTPNTDGVVMHVHCPEKGQHLGFWSKEENDWVLRKRDLGSARVCHKGRLFICRNRTTWAIDLPTGDELLNLWLPDQIGDFYCLVEAAGVLLGIVQHNFCTDRMPLENCWFEVYRLEEEENPPHWTKLSDIGDLMIFLNSNNGFCVSANGFDGIRGNCIYFTKWNGKGDHNSRTLIGRYELGEDRSEVVGHPRYTGGTWIVPNV